MKAALRILLFALAFAVSVPAYAQVAPAPAPAASNCPNSGSSVMSNFSASGSATGFAVVGSSATSPAAASIVDASFQATCRVAVGYETLIVPSVANYQFGMAHYTLPLNALLGKKLAGKLNFDSSQVYVDVKAGVGKVLQSSINKSGFAATVGPTVSIPLNSVVTWNAVGVQYIYGRVAGTSGVIVQPNGLLSNMSVSSGLSFSLGAKK
jgi:hypothetical protein